MSDTQQTSGADLLFNFLDVVCDQRSAVLFCQFDGIDPTYQQMSLFVYFN
jgi:hypothetical protein